MFILLITAVGLVAWSLQLVRSAFRLKEFSLIFAGALVAVSAMGVIMIYLLMDGCLGYFADSSQVLSQYSFQVPVIQQASIEWVSQ